MTTRLKVGADWLTRMQTEADAAIEAGNRLHYILLPDDEWEFEHLPADVPARPGWYRVEPGKDWQEHMDAKRAATLPTIEEQFESHPFLFTRAREGNWQVNRHGTVLTPVWVDLSPAESDALDRLTGRKAR